MASCALCGKHTSFGKEVTKVRTGLFSRTPRKIKPNLQPRTIEINGKRKRVAVCTRCLRTANRIRQ